MKSALTALAMVACVMLTGPTAPAITLEGTNLCNALTVESGACSCTNGWRTVFSGSFDGYYQFEAPQMGYYTVYCRWFNFGWHKEIDSVVDFSIDGKLMYTLSNNAACGDDISCKTPPDAHRWRIDEVLLTPGPHKFRFTVPDGNQFLMYFLNISDTATRPVPMATAVLDTAANPQQMKIPAGCRKAASARGSLQSYVDSIIHEKTGIEMALVPSGNFTRGSGKQAQQVTIKAPFYMGKTEVTNAQYRRFVEATGYEGDEDIHSDPDVDLYLRHWHGKSIMSPEDSYPVVWVNWQNAKAFCKWAGLGLPSEAQWEYACRAGTTTPYYFGEDRKEFGKYGWANTSQEYHTHSGAGKLPNAWGLYDMLGNVWEWMEDDFVSNEYIYGHREFEVIMRFDEPPTDGSARLEGRLTKVLRGGSWRTSEVACQSGTRYNISPVNASADLGFRIVLPLDK